MTKDTYDNIKGKNILIVDYNPLNRLIAEKTLKKAGAKIFFADNGIDAAISVEEENVALVLVGIDKPVAGAYDVLKQVQQYHKNIPIIASTNLVYDETRGKCLQAGFTDYFSIPCFNNELLSTINKHLGK
jgi:CheY-like chemotaxis protein